MAVLNVKNTPVSAEARAYHKDDSSVYVLPNDSPEHARLEMQARLMEGLMYGDVIHAPLEPAKVTRCLDIGCGTGYVTNAMARKYPDAEVIGLDLSPVPNIRQWEQNVKFFEGNVLTQMPSGWKAADGQSTLPHNDSLFDLCWSRLLFMGMTDWPGFFKKSFELLKPGGWAECHEMDAVWYDSNDQEWLTEEQWNKRLVKAMEALGFERYAGSNAARIMKEAGFIDIETVQYRMYFGGGRERTPFLKKAGEFWAKDAKEVVPLSIKRVLSMTGSSEEKINALVEDFERSLVLDVGNYSIVHVTYGRKPE
ncbi:hypothetical protein M409DRAFT_26522 [Zasmidium cellare ATCC 36951]|uniref:Uncharacterized protein n=1 Tax=Zasmidium cellare ATCC 36951 TaxID=1080233 RepID=A0A6A6CC96_ZASCE|nr:uncharacterized protein M409DRAFT_26522 [Zasmidium cellare ATCC 36951]KAF2163076.1 hypothetical protein M409DRAFT_26522 [Zasmidium cellare ATCC 36951]